MSTCQIEEINKGGAYPKSCPTCGLGGKCERGLPHPYEKPDSGRSRLDPSSIKVGDVVHVRARVQPDMSLVDIDADGADCTGPMGWKLALLAHIPAPEIVEGMLVVTPDGAVGTAGKPMDGVVLVRSSAHPVPRPYAVGSLQAQLRPGQSMRIR